MVVVFSDCSSILSEIYKSLLTVQCHYTFIVSSTSKLIWHEYIKEIHIIYFVTEHQQATSWCTGSVGTDVGRVSQKCASIG